MITSILSTQQKTYKILDDLYVHAVINHNPYSLPLEKVFSMAARNNVKRKYLFVSKLIGKHIPVKPQVPLLTGFLLASRLAEYLGLTINPAKIQFTVKTLLDENIGAQRPAMQFNLPGKALFLGFAETATALGHSVYACYAGKANYLHTTREDLPGLPDTIYFTEDHCHAPDQKCLVLKPSLFENNDFIVLIDDEITTGNSGLNIIKALQKKFPQKRYIILAILDWRSTTAKQKYKLTAEELGVEIEVVSLLAGNFTVSGTSAPGISEHYPTTDNDPERGNQSPTMQLRPVRKIFSPLGNEIKLPDKTASLYLRYTGRFGINVGDQYSLEKAAKKLGKELRATRKGKKTLCLGTGEFMYIPFRIAEHMGEGIYVQSTTRSPVHPRLEPEYAIKQALTFYDPVRPQIKNFVYNIPPGHYDEVYIFWERETAPEQVWPLVTAFYDLGITNITFVTHILTTERA